MNHFLDFEKTEEIIEQCVRCYSLFLLNYICRIQYYFFLSRVRETYVSTFYRDDYCFHVKVC